MLIRQALPADMAEAYAIEAISYPPETAASREAFDYRLQTFGRYFKVAEHNGQVVGIANAVRLSHENLADEKMKQTGASDPEGQFLCVLTVAVHPDYRGSGLGVRLMSALLKQAEEDRLEAVLLLCEKHLISFYERLGFQYIRSSASEHGGIPWHEMKRDCR
ncbi:GNAT family N-acetyltransferase [Paenibacillus tyrfis]|uniref:GNAT family N-acetyltransferase n=1 Tax=Paenibacillus tyrfis TaxID=1501230 RepID=UPI0024916E12|nr:GNAT family N-acetyltransferase [Paenibacillus tyrfis]GLI05367.1 GNAT family N-acetyltransferase [Paenibacillus tyrfis]